MKTHRYGDLDCKVQDDKDVIFRVLLVSDGNMTTTTINIPGEEDKNIENNGEEVLGKGRELRQKKAYISSQVSNLAQEESDITIEYSVNGQSLLNHSSPKKEGNPCLILFNIRFI